MDEIIQIVGRDPKAIGDAVDCLEQRLQYRSSVVKHKTLRMVNYITQHGSPDFRRGLLRLSPVIRDLTHFTCAPDPFKGDIPWKRVQSSAKEVMKAIHGSDGGMPSHAEMSHHMEGFGNSGNSRGILDAASSSDGGLDVFGRSMGSLSGFLQSSPSPSMGTAMREQSRGASYTRPRIDAGTTYTPKLGGTADSQHARSMEESTVRKFCAPRQQGGRIAPSSEECKAFRSDIVRCDGKVIAAHLEKSIQNGGWKESLRALCVLDTISEQQQNATESAIVQYFKDNPQSLKRAQDSAQDRVKTRSTSVMSHLGIIDSRDTETVVSTGKDLITTDDFVTTTVPNPATAVANGDVSPTTVETNELPLEREMDTLSLLDSLDHGVPDHLHQVEAPGSPVAGLIFSKRVENTSMVQGKASDPFGEWETGGSLEPKSSSLQPQAPPAASGLDPFQDMLLGMNSIAQKDLLQPDRPIPSSVTGVEDFFTSLHTSDNCNSTAVSSGYLGVGTSIPNSNHSGMTDVGKSSTSLSSQPLSNDALSAWHATTSGFTGSQAREETAFNFVQSAMEQVKKK